MAVNRALGTLDGPMYFENKSGHILLPADSQNARFLESTYRRRGYELRQVNTLPEWDRLEQRLIEQDNRQVAWELERDELVCAPGRQRVRDAMYARSISSATSEYEREFLKLYIRLRPEKRAKYRQRYMERQSYFEALHHDAGHNQFLDDLDKQA